MSGINGTDRLPPHSDEMERGVLGSILIDPSCFNKCLERLKTGAEVFYDLKHQEVYKTIVSLYDELSPIETLTVLEKLKERKISQQIGGIEFLNSLQDSTVSSANLDYYLDAVLEKWTLRRVVQICTQVSQRAYEQDGQIDEILSVVERDILSLNKSETTPTLDGKMAAKAMMEDLQKRHELNGKLSGLSSGLIDLDRMTEGLQFGEQFIIGARPSQGKTALGLGIFRHNALVKGIPSLFVSLEMSVEAVMRRLLSAHREIPLKKLRQGGFQDTQITTMGSFQDQCLKSPMHIIDGVDGLNIRQVCSRIRRHVLKHGIKLVVIDYLQKIRPSTKQEKKTYEVGEVSERLKALAVETGVAMVTLAQLSRESVKTNSPKQTERAPRLSDLADSGQIERDADCVGLIYRKDGKSTLIIAKQRDGEIGIIPLYFNGVYCRFDSFTEE